MNDFERLNAETEQAIGEQHQRAWEFSVEPFIIRKQAELYQVFLDHPTTDTDGLVLIKLQINALQSLSDEFQSQINTGNLARKQLEGEENVT